MVREKVIEARKYTGKREKNEKLYTWKYHVLNVSVYLTKDWVERHGTKYRMLIDDLKGTILIEPLKSEN